MYENMLKDVQKSFQPMLAMVEINRKAAEKMFELQSEYVSNLVNATMSQMQQLTAVTEPQQLIDLQLEYVKQMESQLTEVAEQEFATINAAANELTDAVKTNLDNITQTELHYIDEVSKLVSATNLPEFSAPQTAATVTTSAPVAKKATVKKAPAKKAPAKKAAPKATAKTAAKPAVKPAAKTAPEAKSAQQPAAKTTTAVNTPASSPANNAKPVAASTAAKPESVKQTEAKV